MWCWATGDLHCTPVHSQDRLRKLLTFVTPPSGFPTKWHLRNECRNSLLMMHHYTDLGSTSDWSCCKDNVLQLIRSTYQIRVVMHNQYGISELVPQTLFCRETSGGVVKSQLFSQATLKNTHWLQF